MISSALLIVAVLIAVGGCTSHGGRMQTVPTTTAKQAVQRYADETLAAIGNARWGPDDGLPNPSSEPCDGQPNDVYRMLGIYSIIVPDGQALDTIHRLRDHWRQLGYTITEEKYFPTPPSGDLTARTPNDHYEVGLAAASVEKAFVLNISSPCYKSPTPLN
jgi:hypothetical protein